MIFNKTKFIKITLLTSIWINVSEVFRYFVLVRPDMKAYWNGSEKVADMNWLIFSIWGFWDTLLTALVVFMYWIYAKTFGSNRQSIVVSATLSWAFVFVIFWIATANSGLSDWEVLWITLPLSWVEMVVASYIASKLYQSSFEESLINAEPVQGAIGSSSLLPQSVHEPS